MKNIVVRSLSGIVYVALVVGAVLAGGYWLAALTVLFAVLGIIEFRSITSPGIRDIWYYAALAWDLFCGVLLVMTGLELFQWIYYLPVLVIIYPLVRFTLALYDKDDLSFRRAAFSVLSLIYIAVPLAVINLMETVVVRNHYYLLLAMFVMIWLNDTGAYLVGSKFGRHRLFERLSPKKSWEGFWGGMAFCLVAGAIYSLYVPASGMNIWQGVLFGALVSIFATWGDLFESLIKRRAGVKDSGHIMPGHGGILDRIDSLLFVAPATFVFICLMYIYL